jgi:hypothetical protein
MPSALRICINVEGRAMKLTIWDVFAMVTLFAVVVVGIIFLQIFANPYSAVNPFPPPTMPAALALPTHTITPRSLPATWTPTPGGPVVQEPVSDPMTDGLVSTSTPVPSSTGFTLPTFTPTLTFTITPIPPTVTPTRTVDQASWIRQSPADGAILSPGEDLDMIWTIKNIGTNAWSARYSYEYARGVKMQKKDSYRLNRTVGVDDTIDIIVDMIAPSEPGSYSTSWRLVNETGKSFYTVTFLFTVR